MSEKLINLYFTKQDLDVLIAVLVRTLPMVEDVEMKNRLLNLTSYMNCVQSVQENFNTIVEGTIETIKKENTDVQ